MSRAPRIASRARAYTVAATVVSLIVSAAVFYFAWSEYVVAVRTSELSRQVTAIAAGVEAPTISGDDPSPSDVVEQRLFRVQAGLLGVALYLTDEQGLVTGALLDSGIGLTLPVSGLEGPDARGNRTGVRTLQSGRVIVVAAPLSQGGWLVAAQPLREVRAAQGGILALLALSLAFGVVLAVLASGLLARRLAAPIERLRDAARDVARGTWGKQVEVEGEDEVASLARSFNDMSRRVADAYDAQKQFVGDVSHELRTPITAIRGWAGALADGTASGPDQRDRAIAAIAEESRRLGDLTDTLLALADLDAGAVSFRTGPVDARLLFETLMSRHGMTAESAGLVLEVGRVDPGSIMRADLERTLQALSVLVDNALAYTPAGGTVRLSSELADGEVYVRVDDSGPGVPPESRAAIFERFKRLDRSRSQAGGGSGLGLAICKRLVEIQGGTVSVDDSALGGASFAVRLPAWPDSGGESTQ